MVLMRNWQFFLLFTLGKIGQQNVFNDIIECENASLDYKNNKLKNWDLTKEMLKTWQFFNPFLFLDKIGQQNMFHGLGFD